MRSRVGRCCVHDGITAGVFLRASMGEVLSRYRYSVCSLEGISACDLESITECGHGGINEHRLEDINGCT